MKLLLGLLLGLLMLGLLATRLDAWTIDMSHLFAAPSARHWLGTDDLGRDLLARLAWGVLTSVGVAAVVLVLTAAVGIPLGMAAGWCGGWVDALVTKMTEVVLSFPGLLLALALTALVGPSVVNVILALGLLGWVGFARLARVQVQSLRQSPFLLAAQLGGVRWPRLFVQHLIPLLAPALLVEALLVLAGTMVAEAGLSFLGLGIPAPWPSLGGMLRDGMRDVLVAPWLVILPGVVLVCISVGANVCALGWRERMMGGMEAR